MGNPAQFVELLKLKASFCTDIELDCTYVRVAGCGWVCELYQPNLVSGTITSNIMWVSVCGWLGVGVGVGGRWIFVQAMSHTHPAMEDPQRVVLSSSCISLALYSSS